MQNQFQFGDHVKCRTRDTEWITGFRFLAYVPGLERPFIVKAGDPAHVRFDEPIRAHLECEHDPDGKARIEAAEARLAKLFERSPAPAPAVNTGGNPQAPAPRWTYSTYRAALRLDGRIVALLTPDGVNSFDSEQVRPLIDLLNRDEMTTALLAKTLAQCASNKGVTAIDKAMQIQAEGNRVVHGETFATDAAAHMRQLNE